MFFPEKIVSIKDTDLVLEVGPGGTPYYRSDVLLEKIFDEKEAEGQRGFAPKLETDKKIVYYYGKEFPFSDNEFDYVVCSHVLEHVPEDDFEFFVNELQRVAKKGYIEFPTFYYDYIYNYDEHVTITFYKDNIIYYMSKEKTNLSIFRSTQEFFYATAAKGHVSLTQSLKNYFFQGFEWEGKLQSKKEITIDKLLYNKVEITKIDEAKSNNLPCFQKLKNKIKNFLKYKI